MNHPLWTHDVARLRICRLQKLTGANIFHEVPAVGLSEPPAFELWVNHTGDTGDGVHHRWCPMKIQRSSPGWICIESQLRRLKNFSGDDPTISGSNWLWRSFDDPNKILLQTVLELSSLPWCSQQDHTAKCWSQPSAKLMLRQRVRVSKGSPEKLVPIPNGASCQKPFQYVQIHANIIKYYEHIIKFKVIVYVIYIYLDIDIDIYICIYTYIVIYPHESIPVQGPDIGTGCSSCQCGGGRCDRTWVGFVLASDRKGTATRNLRNHWNI